MAEPTAQQHCTVEGGVPAVAHRHGLGHCDAGHAEAARLAAHRGWSGRRQLTGGRRGFDDDLKDDSCTTLVGLMTGEWRRSGLASSDDATGPTRRGRRKR
jgi:hypothetical protein